MMSGIPAQAHAPPMLPMFVCHECQGCFPTEAIFSQHLMEHNMLRALKARPVAYSGVLPGQQAISPPAQQPSRASGLAPKRFPKDEVPANQTAQGLADGVVVYYNGAGGYGFVRGTAPGAPIGQVYFHISACNMQSPAPAQGEQVQFTEKRGPKGPLAIQLVRTALNPSRAHMGTSGASPTNPGDEPFVHGVVVKYEVLGGFGSIARLDAPLPSADLHFKIGSCDIKRPPPTVGERVMLAESVGPKGPTASMVRRMSLPAGAAEADREASKLKSKKKKAAAKGKEKAAAKGKPTLSPDGLVAALTRAMQMMLRSPTARGTGSEEQQPTPQQARRPSPVSEAPLRADQYEDMVHLLESAESGEIYLPSAIAMPSRTRPVESSTIRAADSATRRVLLLDALREEADSVRLNDLVAKSMGEGAMKLNFGYVLPPSPPGSTRRRPVAARPPPPPPVPEPPRTMRCDICMNDDPVEDMFIVSECDHAYCRDSMRNYILGRIDEQDVTPKCPHDGCEMVL